MSCCPPTRSGAGAAACSRCSILLFFESVEFRRKWRVHFHEFMAQVHERIAAARRSEPGDPIPAVATQIAAQARLLCFDELHVTDIADAMILGRLFKELFEQRVVVVATTNSAPHDLYRNGLNRELFLPFVHLIEEHMDVLELDAAKDFRLEKLAGQKLYFTPADAASRAELDKLWLRLTGTPVGDSVDLEVKGRKLRVPRASVRPTTCRSPARSIRCCSREYPRWLLISATRRVGSST